MQKAHGDCLDTAGNKVIDLLAHLVDVQRRHDLAVPGDAFIDFATPTARDQWRGELQEQVMDVIALLGTHLQDIAESLGGQKSQLAAAALDDGIGHQGRAVDDVADIA